MELLMFWKCKQQCAKLTFSLEPPWILIQCQPLWIVAPSQRLSSCQPAGIHPSPPFPDSVYIDSTVNTPIHWTAGFTMRHAHMSTLQSHVHGLDVNMLFALFLVVSIKIFPWLPGFPVITLILGVRETGSDVFASVWTQRCAGLGDLLGWHTDGPLSVNKRVDSHANEELSEFTCALQAWTWTESRDHLEELCE